jgi:uncharacterized membrane protein
MIQWTDERMDRVIGRLLQVGVAIAAAAVLIGGVLYLRRHGGEVFELQAFQGEPAELRRPSAILWAAIDGRASALIELGFLLLIATPVARVALAGYVFFCERDRLYTFVAGFVLAILIYSLAAA